MTEQAGDHVLGLDMGANSLGWALLRLDGDQPVELVDAGVRVFPAGVDNLDTSKEEPRAVQRRAARQIRRQLKRQGQRMRKLAHVLRDAGLFPEGDFVEGAARNDLLNTLDRELFAEYAAKGEGDQAFNQLPYFLRRHGLDHPLSPKAFGRALYHLAQRRGYQSNRKAEKEEDKEGGVVDQGINELRDAMDAAGARTLGEYFATVDPVHEKRIRARWTARQMYEEEFDALWESQAAHHPGVLTDALRDKVRDAIFHQRPLKSQKGLIGRCELEAGKLRAPRALEVVQRFRYWQKLNDLTVHFLNGDYRPLTDEEKAVAVRDLEQADKITYKRLRKLFEKECGLEKGTEFNFERGGDKDLYGNRTAFRLRAIFGHRWDAFRDDERAAIVGEVLGIQNPATLARRGEEVWGLNAEEAARFGNMKLEAGYSALSKTAVKKILPLMRDQGLPFATARDTAYQDLMSNQVLDRLPPLDKTALPVRNPVVQRSLSEVRKVVNEVIRVYGKPREIHIELAREAKQPLAVRLDIQGRMKKRQGQRDALRTQIIQEAGIAEPKGSDILKALLHEECGGLCPYTGKRITFASLFAKDSPWDVEHIIPFSRCLDDSFMNKTLCYHEENRLRKKNLTPHEAYSEAELDKILQRVELFKGDGRRVKLERFKAKDLKDFEGFSSTKLNDTRYASRLAARYLSRLYGQEALRRIQVSNGSTTAYFRDAWKLNGILNDGGFKQRDDHRHHAVDAVVVALTNRSMVKALSDAADRQHHRRGRSRGWQKHVQPPWEGFLDEVAKCIDAIVVSHRVNHKVAGNMHKDTIYSPPRTDENGKQYVLIRKPLDANFGPKQIEAIDAPDIREAVRRHLQDHGNDPKAAFGNPADHPRIGKHNIPIHKVRIRVSESPFHVGDARQPRHVLSESNHHMVLYAVEDKKGNEKWKYEMVSRYEAIQRRKAGRPVVERDLGEGKRFVCSIAPGDTFCLIEDGEPEYFIARTVSKGTIEFVTIFDARMKNEIKAAKEWRTCTGDSLRTNGFRKVIVTPLGDVVPAND